jgi:hypothetical protein
MSDHAHPSDKTSGPDSSNEVPGTRVASHDVNSTTSATARRQRTTNNSHNANRAWWDIGWDRWIELIFILVVATATVVNVCVANRQWGSMNESNSINLQALTSVQRPFVTVVDLIPEVTEQNAPGARSGKSTSWRFIPEIENSGGTPTKDMEIVVKHLPIRIGPDPALYEEWLRGPTDPVEPSSCAPCEGATGVLGPKSKIRPMSHFYIPGGVELAFVAQDKGLVYDDPDFKRYWRLIVSGRIRYWDRFPNTPEHITKFCYIARPAYPGEAKIDWPTQPIIMSCRHWNCADEECADDKNRYESELAQRKAKTPPN